LSEGEKMNEQVEQQETPAAEAYVQREPLISPEVKDVIDLRRFMEGGEKKEKLSIVELILLQDWLDRREERMLRRNQVPPQIRPEDIAKAVSNAVAETIKPLIQQQQPKQDEEIPEWAKKLHKQQQDILNRLKEEEKEKETKKIIEEAQRPLLDQIKERDHVIEKLQEKINELKEKYESLGAGGGGGKDKLDVYLETEQKLKELGIKKEPKPGTVWLSDEEGPIPVSGELPAWVVYGPIVADRIMSAIEKRINNIASQLGVGEVSQPSPETQAPPEREELIRLPPKPQIPKKTEAPKEEVRSEVKAKAKEAEEELSKMPELIKIPERPKAEPREYTREELEKKKMPELWNIAKRLGIPKKGKKAELIDRILKASGGEEAEREAGA